LLKLNVNEHTEKKQNLTYLSWAWAWQEALKADPKASFKVHTFPTVEDGASPVMNINGTGMVWVDVTLNGTTRTGFLPVMDHRNKPIPEPDAFQVNTALMRCMTKTLALFGLGLYIYAGEDLPENDPDVKPLPPPGVKQPEPQMSGWIPEPVKNKPIKREPPAEPKVDANLELFAEKMKEMVTIATTKDELREFWKANLPQLDILKTENPDLFKSVLKTFKDAQSQMEQA
jgi:hypothetical protein